MHVAERRSYSPSVEIAQRNRGANFWSMKESDVESEDIYDLLIVGAGPCGLAAAISAQDAGLSLGGIPFVVSSEKPSRRDALQIA